jgi:hypothetical protein
LLPCAGGNAEKDGRVQAGDVLVKCSATLLKAGKEGEFEREGYGQRPYDNWEQVKGAAAADTATGTAAEHSWFISKSLPVCDKTYHSDWLACLVLLTGPL